MALLAARLLPARAVYLAVRLAAAWLAVTAPAYAQRPAVDERELKAVFLFNFVQFTEWPSEAFPDPQSPIVIGVLGDDPFGRVLDDVVSGELVLNRPLVIKRFRRVEEISSCHVLFVSPSEAAQYEEIFARLKGRSILTVGDTEGFAMHGGIIRFVTEQNRIRLRVNVGAAGAAGLTISSRLLRAAVIVGTTKAP